MKKVLVIALMLGAGLAYASTLGVPWFMDGGATGSNPPAANGDFGAIYIHSNATAVLEVSIAYYTAVGNYIGPDAPYNTFYIQPNASLGFRPVQDDPSQESVEARKIPNRPVSSVPPNDNKKNGSIVFSWLGPNTYLQGAFAQYSTVTHVTSSTNTTPVYMLQGYGHLLPPGI